MAMALIRQLRLPWDVRVYRVEARANQRLTVDTRSRVAVWGTGMLFLNFGQLARARQFWIRRVAQGMDCVAIRSFRVRRLDVRRMRLHAVPERLAATYPHRPLIVDRAWPDQFGLRQSTWERLIRDAVSRGGRAWDEP
jgi:filamentous hemagglutinin